MEFRPGQSMVHRLHPIVKLVWLLWVTVVVFVVDPSAAGHEAASVGSPTVGRAVFPLIVAGCAVGLLWLSGAAPWRIPGIRIWVSLGTLILVLHSVFSGQGHPSAGLVTTAGLIAGLRAAGRLLAVILMSFLFVMTTEPVSLACSLMRIGLPYRWGFTLVTALRLAPVFRVEAHHVYRAQLVRGVAYDAAGPRRWWLMLRHLCLPLLVSAVRTAHSLSLSMEGRAFGLHRRRTFMSQAPVTRRDIAAVVLLIASFPMAVWHGCTPPWAG